MEKSRTTNGQKVKNSSRYERDMERSFAVIYHNLKRLQDEKPPQERSRRRHSEPEISSFASSQKHEQNPHRQRSNATVQSLEATALYPRGRRVSFSGSSLIHTFSKAIPVGKGSRPAEQLCKIPEREKDKELQCHMF